MWFVMWFFSGASLGVKGGEGMGRYLVDGDGRVRDGKKIVLGAMRLCRRCGLTVDMLVEMERHLRAEENDKRRPLLGRERW